MVFYSNGGRCRFGKMFAQGLSMLGLSEEEIS